MKKHSRIFRSFIAATLIYALSIVIFCLIIRPTILEAGMSGIAYILLGPLGALIHIFPEDYLFLGTINLIALLLFTWLVYSWQTNKRVASLLTFSSYWIGIGTVLYGFTA